MIGIIVFAAIFLATVVAMIIRGKNWVDSGSPIIEEILGIFAGTLVSAFVVSIIFALSCCLFDSYSSVTDRQKDLETIVVDFEQGGTLSSVEKSELLDEIKECNDDIKYLKEHYNSKWNGALIPDEAKNLKEIPIPDFLKSFN